MIKVFKTIEYNTSAGLGRVINHFMDNYVCKECGYQIHMGSIFMVLDYTPKHTWEHYKKKHIDDKIKKLL